MLITYLGWGKLGELQGMTGAAGAQSNSHGTESLTY